jgi:hypothetical protein
VQVQREMVGGRFPHIQKYATRLIELCTKCCFATDEQSSIRQTISDETRIKEITGEEMDWLQGRVDWVRSTITETAAPQRKVLPPTFDDGGSKYMPYKRRILEDIEGWRKEQEAKTKDDASTDGVSSPATDTGKEKKKQKIPKAFTLLPISKIRAAQVCLNNTVLAAIVKELAKDSEEWQDIYDKASAAGTQAAEEGGNPKDKDELEKLAFNDCLWNTIFWLNKISKHIGSTTYADATAAGTAIRFEQQIVTNGVSSGVLVSRRKSTKELESSRATAALAAENSRHSNRILAMKKMAAVEHNTTHSKVTKKQLQSLWSAKVGSAPFPSERKKHPGERYDLQANKFVRGDGPLPTAAATKERVAELAKLYDEHQFDVVIGVDPGQSGTKAVVHSRRAEEALLTKGGEPSRGAVHRHQVR